MTSVEFSQAQNVMSTFGIRAQSGMSVVTFAIGADGTGEMASTYGDDVSTLTDERADTITQYAGGAPRLTSRVRYVIPFSFRLTSLVTVAGGAADVALAAGHAVARGPNALTKAAISAVKDKEMASVIAKFKSEFQRVRDAGKEPFARFSIPFVIECEVVGITYTRSGEVHKEWDIRARVAPHHGESKDTRFRNFFCEKATFSLKGTAYTAKDAPYCEYHWSFYADGKRLRSMATEREGLIRLTVESDTGNVKVQVAEGGLVTRTGQGETEALPTGRATSGDASTTKATKDALMAAVEGAGEDWKPDRAKVREAFRNHVRDQYGIALDDGRAQARVNEVFSAQPPAKWMLFLGHVTGDLRKSALRDALTAHGVYRSDEQAGALAADLTKMLDEVFKAYKDDRAKSTAGAGDTEKVAAAKAVADSYRQQLDLLEGEARQGSEGAANRLMSLAAKGFVEVARARFGVTSAAQAKRRALGVLGRGEQDPWRDFQDYADHIDREAGSARETGVKKDNKDGVEKETETRK